jgi:hypothetical protein
MENNNKYRAVAHAPTDTWYIERIADRVPIIEGIRSETSIQWLIAMIERHGEQYVRGFWWRTN